MPEFLQPLLARKLKKRKSPLTHAEATTAAIATIAVAKADLKTGIIARVRDKARVITATATETTRATVTGITKTIATSRIAMNKIAVAMTIRASRTNNLVSRRMLNVAIKTKGTVKTRPAM